MMNTTIENKEQTNLKICPDSEAALLRIMGKNNELLVYIEQNGNITFGENYTPDLAAQTFWSAMATFNTCDIDLTKFNGEFEPLDTPKKVIDHLQAQIKELGDFILKNYDDYICGSAVETAIQVMDIQSQKLLTAHVQQNMMAKSMHQPIEDEIDDGMSSDDLHYDDAQHYPKVKKAGKINLIIPRKFNRINNKSVDKNVSVEEADYNRAKKVI